jgi:hypothetical protein
VHAQGNRIAEARRPVPLRVEAPALLDTVFGTDPWQLLAART